MSRRASADSSTHSNTSIGTLLERLRPGAIASNAADKVKRVARDTVRDVADSDGRAEILFREVGCRSNQVLLVLIAFDDCCVLS